MNGTNLFHSHHTLTLANPMPMATRSLLKTLQPALWVQAHGIALTPEDKDQWNDMVVNGEPKNEMLKHAETPYLPALPKNVGGLWTNCPQS